MGRPSGSGSCGAGEICCGDIVCNPSCPSGPECGGSNGCGGTCSSADNGAPPRPTINTPTDGGIALMNTSTGQVRINWTNTDKADRWQYELFPQGVVSCSDPDARCGTVNISRLDFTPTALNYQFRVRALNIDCGTDYSSWTSYITFTVHAPVTGTVYLDSNNTASLTGGVCTTGDSLPPLQAGASAVGIEQNGEEYAAGSVAADGTYQASAPYWDPGNNLLQLNIGDSHLYTCTCPAGCVYSGISSPQAGVNFFLIEARDPWFQAAGGPVTALQETGTAIRNYIPDSCTTDAGCQPYLITQAADTENTSGYLMTGGGVVDLRQEAGNQTASVDQDGRNIVGTVDRKVVQERYEYFLRLYKFPETPEDDFTTSANDAQKPTLTPQNDDINAYYHSGDLRIEDDWSVASGEEIVVFVDGNVTIAGEIQTAVGGFTAIIASGDITIDPAVEHADLTATDGLVEGVFIANGQILLPSRGPENGGDGKFVGEGTFVGWSGIVMERDYDDYAGRKSGEQPNSNRVILNTALISC
ncbi:FapA family protein [Candidatus Woesebacteria bacterium]|nr:FapA family protein [Candidatus Woesebacteria bacterium]